MIETDPRQALFAAGAEDASDGRLGGGGRSTTAAFFGGGGGGGGVTFTLVGGRGGAFGGAFGGGGGGGLGRPWGGAGRPDWGRTIVEATAIFFVEPQVGSCCSGNSIAAYTLGYFPEGNRNSVNGAVIH